MCALTSASQNLILAGYPRNRPQGAIYVRVVYDVLGVRERGEGVLAISGAQPWRELRPKVWGLLKYKTCL